MSLDGQVPYPDGAMDMKEFVMGDQGQAARLAVPGKTSMDEIKVSGTAAPAAPQPERKGWFRK